MNLTTDPDMYNVRNATCILVLQKYLKAKIVKLSYDCLLTSETHLWVTWVGKSNLYGRFR